MSKPILKEKDILNPNEAIELFVLSRRKLVLQVAERKPEAGISGYVWFQKADYPVRIPEIPG